MSLPPGTLKNWVYAARQGNLAAVGKNQKPLTDLEMELARVKRELAEVVGQGRRWCRLVKYIVPLKKGGGLLREGVAVK